MNERKQLSALTLVLFAFATLCAVLLIIGGLFFFGLGSIERSNQREQSRALKKLAVIDDIGQDVGEMQASVAREVLASNVNEINLLDQEIRSIEATNGSEFRDFQPYLDHETERQLYDGAARARKLYWEQTQVVMALSRANQDSAAIKLVNATQAPAYDQYREAINKLIDHMEGDANDSTAATTVLISKIRILGNILVLLAILVVLGTGFAVKAVARRLNEDNQRLQFEVTERKKAELEIQLLAAFPRFNPNPVLELSVAGEVKFFNQAAVVMARELGQETITEMLPPDTAAIVRQCVAAGTPKVCVETQIGPRVISWSFFPIKATNTVHCYGGDSTERKRTEEALQASQQIVTEIINAIPVRVFWKDKNLAYLGCNAAFARDAGFADPKDIIGKYDYQMVWRDQAEGYCKDDRQVIESGRSKLLVEESQTTPDGNRITLLTNKVPLHDSEGKIEGVIGTYMDITERKQSEERLRLHSAALEAAANAIVITDKSGSIQTVNPAFTALTGYTAEEVVGKTPRILKSGNHDESFYRNLWQTISSGRVWSGEMSNRRKDGSLYAEEMTITPLLNAQGEIVRYIAIKQDITRRKRAEEKLTLFRALIERSQDGIYIVDPDTARFLDANESGCHALGYTRDELLKFTVCDVVPGPDRAAFETGNAKIEKKGHALMEILHRRKDGTTFPAEASLSFVKLDRKYQVAIVRDITERKQMEAALRESQEKFKGLFDGSCDAIMTAEGSSGKFTSGNPAAVKMFGAKSEAEFICYTPAQLSPDRQPDGRPSAEKAREMIETALRKGSHLFEWTHRRIGGEAFPATVLITRMQSGDKVFQQATVRDITESKLVEAARDRLVAILESTTDLVSIADPLGRLIYLNRAGRNLLGVGLDDDITTAAIRDFLPNPDSHPDFTEGIPATIRHGNWKGEVVILSRGGQEIPVSQVILAHKNPDGKIEFMSTTMRDITERKRFEAKLFQAQKMETVGNLAGGIAHEFNSILTTIIGQCESLLGNLPTGGLPAKRAIEISQAATRAATLTRQLLAFGRKQFLQPEILDLDQIIAGLEGVFRPLLGRNVATQIVSAPGLHPVSADAGQIEQVIMNLVMNARDAMPNGGKLTLETSNVSFDEETVQLEPGLEPGDYVMLVITNTGAGMSEKVKAHLFEPFFTTKGVGNGTGLGLSTCFGIIKQSGGHISVLSEPGQGTTLKVYLPRVEKQAPAPLQLVASEEFPRGTETILLVEAEPALREMATDLLRQLGYSVLAAANGIEALNVKQPGELGRIDLLFTDAVMPHMSGMELADRVRALYPHAKILFSSGYTENAILQQGELDKGVATLQKPFTPSALAHRLREVLDQPSALEPDTAQPSFTSTKNFAEAGTSTN